MTAAVLVMLAAAEGCDILVQDVDNVWTEQARKSWTPKQESCNVNTLRCDRRV